MSSKENTNGVTGLARNATWRTGFLMAMGVVLLILASAGPLAQQIGPVSIAVWGIAAFLGIFHVLIYSELGSMYPDAVGGMTVMMGDAFDRYSKWPKVITMWSYWYGWIPVCGIMPMLIAEYLNQMLGTAFNPYMVAIGILVLLFVINYFGIQVSETVQLVVSIVSILPLAFIIIMAFAKGAIQFSNLVPFRPYGEWGSISNPVGSWTSAVSWLGIGAAFYVATWSAYAFETITVYVGEYKDPVKDTVKAAWSSGIMVTVAYTLIALALVGVLGVSGFAENPDYPFFKLSETVLGGAGAKIAMFIIIMGLFLMANTAFNGTARIMYGMSKDGLNLKQWLKLSPNGFPFVGAIFNVGAAILLMTFEVPVRIIAASNLAYMICMFMPLIAFLVLRKTRPDHPRPYKLSSVFVPIALLLILFDIILIIPGAMLYGTTVMLTGSVITLLIIPFYLYRKNVQDKVKLPAEVQVVCPDCGHVHFILPEFHHPAEQMQTVTGDMSSASSS